MSTCECQPWKNIDWSEMSIQEEVKLAQTFCSSCQNEKSFLEVLRLNYFRNRPFPDDLLEDSVWMDQMGYVVPDLKEIVSQPERLLERWSFVDLSKVDWDFFFEKLVDAGFEESFQDDLQSIKPARPHRRIGDHEKKLRKSPRDLFDLGMKAFKEVPLTDLPWEEYFLFDFFFDWTRVHQRLDEDLILKGLKTDCCEMIKHYPFWSEISIEFEIKILRHFSGRYNCFRPYDVRVPRSLYPILRLTYFRDHPFNHWKDLSVLKNNQYWVPT